MTEEKITKRESGWYGLGKGTRNLIIIAGFIGLAGCLVLFGFLFMWVWNWIMPKIFGLPGINYWEGWGIVALAYVLFQPKHLTANLGEKRRIHKLRRRMEEAEAEKV